MRGVLFAILLTSAVVTPCVARPKGAWRIESLEANLIERWDFESVTGQNGYTLATVNSDPSIQAGSMAGSGLHLDGNDLCRWDTNLLKTNVTVVSVAMLSTSGEVWGYQGSDVAKEGYYGYRHQYNQIMHVSSNGGNLGTANASDLHGGTNPRPVVMVCTSTPTEATIYQNFKQSFAINSSVTRDTSYASMGLWVGAMRRDLLYVVTGIVDCLIVYNKRLTEEEIAAINWSKR